MSHCSARQNRCKPLALGWFLVCFCFGLAVVPVGAEGGANEKSAATASEENSGFSTDTLQEQITDLDGQIQKLREKSLELQEKTRAKLQAQLELFKKERDTLVPRIEKLRDNSELAWQDIKENIQKVIEDLNTSVDTVQ